MYKLLPPDMFGKQLWVLRLSDFAQIRANGDGPDAQKLRQDIMDGAELQDAESNPMSQEAAIEFVRGLP